MFTQYHATMMVAVRDSRLDNDWRLAQHGREVPHARRDRQDGLLSRLGQFTRKAAGVSARRAK